MHRKFSDTWPIAVVALALVLPVGCGSNVLPPLGEAQGLDLLNQLTAGDLADAFDRFRLGLPDAAGLDLVAGLSDEQRTAIESFQGMLDGGEWSPDEFVAAVTDVLGDRLPDTPFAGIGFLGSPFAAPVVSDALSAVGLSDEEVREARLIYEALHADIDDVRKVAQDQIRAVLSVQQRLILDDVSAQLFDGLGVPEAQRGTAKLAFDVLVDRLGLTLGQQEQVQNFREEMRAAVEMLHDSARQEFLSFSPNT